ncbi:hypothetical protein F5Y12DRAFT_790064 [Xylaria sp. FL1777]|nr:hypothetical protein F5Y12DRAFT_790064 [Xylaria sp. FL1777]
MASTESTDQSSVGSLPSLVQDSESDMAGQDSEFEFIELDGGPKTERYRQPEILEQDRGSEIEQDSELRAGQDDQTILGPPQIPKAGILWWLMPSQPESTILDVAPSDEAYNPARPEFSYISYDDSDPNLADIRLDGYLVKIPAALETSLRENRKFNTNNSPVLCYADILSQPSINRDQYDHIMQTCVTGAQGVLGYLGPVTASTDKVFDILAHTSSLWYLAVEEQAAMGKSSGELRRGVVAMLNETKMSSLQTGDDDTLCCAIEAHYDLPYWDSFLRVREMVRAQQVVKALRHLPGMPRKPRLVKGFQMARAINTLRQKYNQECTTELGDLLRISRDCHYEDPRQLVYEMIPLCIFRGKPPLTPLPVIDSSKPIDQVFVEAASFILNDSQKLDIWRNEVPPCLKTLRGLPSWVPDFTIGLRTLPVLQESALVQWNLDFRARATAPIVNIVDNILTVPARFLDEITYVSPIIDNENVGRICSEQYEDIDDLYTEPTRSARWMDLVKTLGRNHLVDKHYEHVVQPFPDYIFQSFLTFVSDWRKAHGFGYWKRGLALNHTLLNRMQLEVPSDAFIAILQRNAFGRRLFKTTSGSFGMTAVENLDSYSVHNEVSGNEYRTNHPSWRQNVLPPVGVTTNDQIVAIPGGYSSYVVRFLYEDTYEFVGDCYLHEIEQRMQDPETQSHSTIRIV